MKNVSGFLVWGFSFIFAALVSPPFAAAQLGDLPVVDQPSQPHPTKTVSTPAPSLYRVHLAVDGNVPGSVKAQDKIGTLTPARATISVFRDGLLLSTTHSNEQGRFQLPGLLPGTYSVIAESGSRMGVFAVQVLPHLDGAAVSPVALAAADDQGESSLDLVLSTDIEDQPLEMMPMETYAAPIMSGGGGGGGGGGALLGLAGLAGLAGLGGLGGSGTASPVTP